MKQAHTSNWIRYLHNAVSWACTFQHDGIGGHPSFNSQEELIDHMSVVHSNSLKTEELHTIARKCKVTQLRKMDTCPLCSDPHFAVGHDIDSDEAQVDIDPQDRVIRESANHARIASFVGRHLKSLAFLALQKLLDEPEQTSDRESSMGHNTSERPVRAGSYPSLDYESELDEPLDFRDEPSESETLLNEEGHPLPEAQNTDMYEHLMANLSAYNQKEDPVMLYFHGAKLASQGIKVLHNPLHATVE
jgi:hypothetical protein